MARSCHQKLFCLKVLSNYSLHALHAACVGADLMGALNLDVSNRCGKCIDELVRCVRASSSQLVKRNKG